MGESAPVPLITAEQIDQRVSALADEISSDYFERTPLVAVVLDGALVFAADLIRQIRCDLLFDTVGLRSYDGTVSTGRPCYTKHLTHSVADRDLLIVEDILDTGSTLGFLVDELMRDGARSVSICVLLEKTGRRQVSVEPRYVGFQIPDRFVVGYGLDHRGLYRNLPFIACLD